MGRDSVFFANSPVQGVLFGKTGLAQDSAQAAGGAPGLAIPETSRQGGQDRRQMGQDVGGDEAQLRQTQARQGGKDEVALQAQQLLSDQRHFLARPAVEI